MVTKEIVGEITKSIRGLAINEKNATKILVGFCGFFYIIKTRFMM